MRAFHYKQEIAQKAPVHAAMSGGSAGNSSFPVNIGGEDQLEQLKKQIENLKRGIQWEPACILLF